MSPLCRSIRLMQAFERATAIRPLMDIAIREMGLLNLAREMRLPLSRSQTIRLWSSEYVTSVLLACSTTMPMTESSCPTSTCLHCLLDVFQILAVQSLLAVTIN